MHLFLLYKWLRLHVHQLSDPYVIPEMFKIIEVGCKQHKLIYII